jgi:ubiquinone biosynthesis protein
MAQSPSDLAVGAFDENPPWTVDPDALVWRAEVPRLRTEVRDRLPSLITPPRRPPLRRGLTVTSRLTSALAQWWVTGRRQDRSTSWADLSHRLRLVAEQLGPTYIKLGQILSSGEGIFPPELVAEFSKCRDRVPPETFATVKRVIEAELGRPLTDVFAHVESRPIAAASIAQVHPARLRDGTDVVVKVQRPTVDELVHLDLRVMAWLAPKLVGRIPVAALANPPALVEVFGHTISEELDFRIEAENMLDVARVFADLDQRQFVVPRPHPELVTRRMLVMERLEGFGFDDLESYDHHGVDTHAIVRAGMIGFMEGALIHGVFHGDLHGGNIFVRPDGRTALLDYGITGRLSRAKRLAFVRLLIAGTMNDVSGQLKALRDLEALPADTDIEAVARDLGLHDEVIDPTSMEPEELIRELQRVVKALLAYGARMPKELMLFVKNMVFLDGAIARLAPDIDLFAEIAHVASYFAATHGERLAREVGMDPTVYEYDEDGIRAAFGVDDSVETMTYRQLQERRQLIRSRLQARA